MVQTKIERSIGEHGLQQVAKPSQPDNDNRNSHILYKINQNLSKEDRKNMPHGIRPSN
jgi:hypothetical protein